MRDPGSDTTKGGREEGHRRQGCWGKASIKSLSLSDLDSTCVRGTLVIRGFQVLLTDGESRCELNAIDCSTDIVRQGVVASIVWDFLAGRGQFRRGDCSKRTNQRRLRKARGRGGNCRCVRLRLRKAFARR